MLISSRTPEGDPNRCPICGKALRLESSLDTRDGPCPHCGHLLWFPEVSRSARSSQTEASDLADALLRILTARFGPLSTVTRAGICGITDANRLASALDRALAVQSFDELLAVL